MIISLPSRALPMVDGVGYALDCTMTLEWLASDPFNITMQCRSVAGVVEAHFDITLLNQTITECTGQLMAIARGANVGLRYGLGCFGVKFDSEGGDHIYITTVGEFANQVAQFNAVIVKTINGAPSTVAALIDAELEAMFGGGNESQPNT